jgi:hypothetical protein
MELNQYYKMKNNYSHVVVIGNGFDLNLGLKTAYQDFIKSDDFRKLYASGNNLVKHLQSHYSLNNWIDIENQLKEYSNKELSSKVLTVYQNEFRELSDSLRHYLKRIKLNTLSEETHAYQLLKQITDKDFLILDFNYTNTIKDILKSKIGDIDNKLIKVHGSIDEDQIIFGVEDNAAIRKEHVFLKKAFNRSFKAVNMQPFFRNAKELFFFGHSLGETDHTYFKNFILERSDPYTLSNEKKTIHIYHFGDNGYDQLHRQLDVLTANRLSGFKQRNEIRYIDSQQPFAK